MRECIICMHAWDAMPSEGACLSCPQSRTTIGVGFIWGCLSVCVCVCVCVLMCPEKKHYLQVPASVELAVSKRLLMKKKKFASAFA
jgi:hypothetical protein